MPGDVSAPQRSALGLPLRAANTQTPFAQLAEKFHMALTGMTRHGGVLELAGLVTTHKVGHVRICKLGLRRLEEEAVWNERYRKLWDARFLPLDRPARSCGGEGAGVRCVRSLAADAA